MFQFKLMEEEITLDKIKEITKTSLGYPEISVSDSIAPLIKQWILSAAQQGFCSISIILNIEKRQSWGDVSGEINLEVRSGLSRHFIDTKKFNDTSGFEWSKASVPNLPLNQSRLSLLGYQTSLTHTLSKEGMSTREISTLSIQWNLN